MNVDEEETNEGDGPQAKPIKEEEKEQEQGLGGTTGTAGQGSLEKPAREQTENQPNKLGNNQATGTGGDGTVSKAGEVKESQKATHESPLFVSSDSDMEDDSDNNTDYVDTENVKAIYTPQERKPASDGQTIGWCGGRSRLFINMYGKKSAARYRLEEWACTPEYENAVEAGTKDNENFSNSHNRYGDQKQQNGKWMYTRRHILGLFGVAWRGSNAHGQDVEDLNPAQLKLQNKSWRDVNTKVLVAWQIGDEVKKTWETRSCLRNRWKDADEIIYQAAKEAEARYDEARTGTRQAYSRSPSKGLASTDVDKHRAQSLPVKATSPRPGRSAMSPSGGFRFSHSDFLTAFAALSVNPDFTNSTLDERKEMVQLYLAVNSD
ncbi:hypothetical protein B0T11DRAFT_282976 [Plectosphaerella cucumerina]|uniref:Uncharacterized protein n=1 Tax=Plectosphaerella cucumerina TaxID=40658 RepID=A0A8K0TJC6_9PEZI|nr:hypothetical protein B0T11DRAFT_282973 [Plectosphaerella cucumerina]KAH7363653.1 hypothetical protein B0T11DRAFT_282976 [Plectosphaerella cucumerina]